MHYNHELLIGIDTQNTDSIERWVADTKTIQQRLITIDQNLTCQSDSRKQTDRQFLNQICLGCAVSLTGRLCYSITFALTFLNLSIQILEYI